MPNTTSLTAGHHTEVGRNCIIGPRTHCMTSGQKGWMFYGRLSSKTLTPLAGWPVLLTFVRMQKEAGTVSGSGQGEMQRAGLEGENKYCQGGNERMKASRGRSWRETANSQESVKTLLRIRSLGPSHKYSEIIVRRK